MRQQFNNLQSKNQQLYLSVQILLNSLKVRLTKNRW